MIFNVIGAALGIGSAVAGVVGGAQSDAAERKAVKRQNEYNQDVYDYEWDEYLRRFEYDEESLEIRKRNEEAQFAYSDETAKRRYQYDLAINQYSFDLANEQYNKSVDFDLDTIKIYNDQIIQLSKPIFIARKKFFNEFKEIVVEKYAQISENQEEISIEYKRGSMMRYLSIA